MWPVGGSKDNHDFRLELLNNEFYKQKQKKKQQRANTMLTC